MKLFEATNSLQTLVTQKVREGFEKMMTEEIDKIEKAMKQRLQDKIDEARREARKTANAMTLELLQKMDVAGISLEMKL